MLAGSEYPESGVLGDLQGAAQIRRLREGDNFHAAGGGVVNDAGERGGTIPRQNEAANSKKGGGTEDRAEVVRVLDLVEGDPEIRTIGNDVGEEFFQAEGSPFVDRGFAAAFPSRLSRRGPATAVRLGRADLDRCASFPGGIKDIGPGTGRLGRAERERGD